MISKLIIEETKLEKTIEDTSTEGFTDIDFIETLRLLTLRIKENPHMLKTLK